MTTGVTLLSQLLDRVTALAATAGDTARRLRYQRSALRGLATGRTRSDDPSHRDASSRWLPPISLHGRSHTALECRGNTQVVYQVTLPANATVVSWIAVPPGPWSQRHAAVEFDLRVEAAGGESSAHRSIDSRRHGHWYLLRVRAPAAGPARIALTATAAASDEMDDDRPALWGDPSVEVPRSAASLGAALQSKLPRSARGLWPRARVADEKLYALWMRHTRASRRALLAQGEWSRARSRTLSLLTFVPSLGDWPDQRTAASVNGQSYPNWEWILAASEDSIERGQQEVARLTRDPRVRVVAIPATAGRAEAWNTAWRAAGGDFAAVMGVRDALSPSALYEMAQAMERAPDADLLYSDEDRVARDPWRRFDPHFKPDWSPELLLAHNYIGRLAMIRSAAAAALDGFRDGYDGAEEWDLMLRLSRSGARPVRVAKCVYHRDQRDQPGGPGEPAAIRDHWERLGHAVDVSGSQGGYRLTWPLRQQPLVSIVIPNRNSAAVIAKCVDGLLRGTRYPHRELVIVDNGTTDRAVLDLYRSLEPEHGVIVPFDGPFNFSAACNAGAARARGDLLLFLNNDIEVIHPDWLDELVRWAQQPEIGIVGAKLLYPDGKIQHAGVVFGLEFIGHIFSRAPEGTTGVFGSTESYRNYLGVTGACQLMRREVFTQLGGFDERYRLAFSDIVLCLEAWKAGYRVVYTPHARLVHHESYTRKRDGWPEDLEYLVRYLEDNGFTEDPYFHPELDPRNAVPALRPPFDPTPRQAIRTYVGRVLSAAAAAGR